jgi:hypothetical protein
VAQLQERASLPHCGFNTAGISLWSFSLSCGRSKGRSTSRSSCSKISCSRNLRQIADALAKGKLAITIVLGRSEYKPFLNAGLPIKEAPTLKEGLPASSGYGVLGIVKNPAPSEYGQGPGQLVLGKEGQEFYARVMKQGTRRLDIDTKWMSQIGVDAAKDVIWSRNIIVSETTSKTK